MTRPRWSSRSRAGSEVPLLAERFGEPGIGRVGFRPATRSLYQVKTGHYLASDRHSANAPAEHVAPTNGHTAQVLKNQRPLVVTSGRIPFRKLLLYPSELRGQVLAI
jgi:hypothetical protein